MASCIIQGVEVSLTIDVGIGPFVLDRDELDTVGKSELNATEDVAIDLADITLTLSYRSGPSSPKGLTLTQPSAGVGMLSLTDTTRIFDPLNRDSPAVDFLRQGEALRVLIASNDCKTLFLQRWSHDLGTSESVLEFTDFVGLAGQLQAPAMTVAAGSTAAQALELVTAAGWPSAFTQTGGSAFERTAWDWDGGSLLEALNTVRLTERAVIYDDNLNAGIGWRGSDTPYQPASSATINCDGVFLQSLELSKNDERVRNVVIVADDPGPGDYRDVESALIYGERTLRTSWAELALDFLSDASNWAAAALLELARASILTQLGTMRPIGASEVVNLLTAEDGETWLVRADEVTPNIARLVRLWGMGVKITADGFEVDAVTGDIGDFGVMIRPESAELVITGKIPTVTVA